MPAMKKSIESKIEATNTMYKFLEDLFYVFSKEEMIEKWDLFG